MITAWTKHLTTPEEKDKYIKSLRHSKWILDDLSKILIEYDAQLESLEISPRAYDNANWSFKQADTNGYRRALKTVLNLIELKEKDDRSISTATAGRPPAT